MTKRAGEKVGEGLAMFLCAGYSKEDILALCKSCIDMLERLIPSVETMADELEHTAFGKTMADELEHTAFGKTKRKEDR